MSDNLNIDIKSTIKVFGGNLIRFSHNSIFTRTLMTCSVYIPQSDTSVPCILYLSGLTCTDENVCIKSGIFKRLAELKIGFIAPDTSPRGAGVAGEADSWDFGVGAGFYLNATKDPWNVNYNMYSYITEELLLVVEKNFTNLNVNRTSIMGHSMGGHGALTIALKKQSKFRSVSAFSPICNPSQCPWGIKAFSGYLGEDRSLWSEYDATQLLVTLGSTSYDDILIDIGTADSFLKGLQLLPEPFQEAANKVGQKITIRYQDGYDHSYYFISSFIEDHVNFHAQRLLG
eukprot:gene14890-20025_t